MRDAAERRRAAEAERLAQLEHRQRRKQEVQVCVMVCGCRVGWLEWGVWVGVCVCRHSLQPLWGYP